MTFATVSIQQTLFGDLLYVQPKKRRNRRPKSIPENQTTLPVLLPFKDFGIIHEHSKKPSTPPEDYEPEPEQEVEERMPFHPNHSTVERSISNILPNDLTQLIMKTAGERIDYQDLTKVLDDMYNSPDLIEKPDRYKIFQILKDSTDYWQSGKNLTIENGVAYYKEDDLTAKCISYYFRFWQEHKIPINYEYLDESNRIITWEGIIEDFEFYTDRCLGFDLDFITTVKIDDYTLRMSRMRKMWIKVDLRRLYS